MNQDTLEKAAACVRALLGDRADARGLASTLAGSLRTIDPACAAAMTELRRAGLGEAAAAKLLAYGRSCLKYGYEPKPATFDHLQALEAAPAKPGEAAVDLAALFLRPVVLMKAAWLYEHAPYFVFRGGGKAGDLDTYIRNFAQSYATGLLAPPWDFSDWEPMTEARRLRRTGFWDSTSSDPVALIRDTATQRLEGLELSVDFHAFNPNRCLPDEYTLAKRREIREACVRSGVRLDLHSPIIGPYTPTPDPARGGRQRFYNPAHNLVLMEETIDLARDVGAEALVIHLIDASDPAPLVRMVRHAEGSDLRVTIENYCQVGTPQTSEAFIAVLSAVRQALPAEVARRNLGVTLDLGHLNIEGEDPLVGAERVGRWCRDNGVYLRLHATDNYGALLFEPPHFSADVHANVAGRGINNAAIITMLRSMGLRVAVVAEQIKPLTREDIETIHNAQSAPLPGSFEEMVEEGGRRLAAGTGQFLSAGFVSEPAYQFLAGQQSVYALQEYAVHRRIQNKANLSVDEARRISGDFTRMPDGVKGDLTAYMDALLLPVQSETGASHRTELDLVCQNISGAGFWTAGADSADHVFATDRICHLGETVCEQGQNGSEMYYVKTGRVDVTIDGSRVASLGPGEIFGEISLFYNIPRSATVRAADQDTRLGVLSREDLERLFECRRTGVFDLVERLYRALPERLRNMNNKYRTAIRTLHLVAGAEEKALVEMERAAMAVPTRREIQVLPTFSSADLEIVAPDRRNIAAGETIVEQDVPGDGAYFMLSGKAQVSVPSTDGPEIVVGEVNSGEIFGEMALIDDKPRSASVRAVTACEVAFTGKAAFCDLLAQRSPLAFRLMGFICSSMFRRILRLDRVYAEIKRRHRTAAAGEAGAAPEAGLTQDIIQTIFEHRLQQTDVDRILQELSTTHRDTLITKLADLLRRISALIEVSTRMSDTLSLDILLPRLMAIVTDAMGADRSTLFLNDPETNDLFSRVAQGEAVNEIRFPNRVGIAGSVFASGQSVMIHDAYTDPRFNPEVDHKTGYRTRNILCTPLRNKGRIIGVAQVLNKREGNFDDADLRLLEALTSQAAAALENAQLYERVEKARKEEAQLLEVTSVIASELHLDTLLAKVIAATTEILDADRSTLFMYDAKAGELWSRVAEGMATKEIRFPATAGIAGTCFSSGDTVNIPDAYADPRFNPAVDRRTGYRTRNILCMPVANKNGQKLAVLQVLNKRGGPFTGLDERRLRSFCAQVAIALENAQLFEDVKNERNFNESILKSLSNGVITMDIDGRVTKLNVAVQKILGWDEAAVLGRPLREVFPEPANHWILDSLDKVVASGAVDITVDAEITVTAAKPVSANLTVVPLIDVNEVAIGYMLVLEDITTEKRVKSTMARYMTKEVADRLLESEDALGGVSQVATVLFSDIRGFTTMAEDLGPRDTVSLLNDYFTCMVDVIFEHNGILDKYLADGLMALFGAPFPGPEDADHAVAVGNEMIRVLRRFNHDRAAAGKGQVRIGVGISSGELVAGNIGSPKRMDYTVIGDPANLASRLEGASKYYRVPVLMSEFTFRQLKRPVSCRPLDLIRVVGKRKPVTVYEVMGHHTPETFPNLDAVVKAFSAGVTQYRKRNWDKALGHFADALKLHPDDAPSALYTDRCLRCRETPPDDSWDGVWAMDHK